jgi:hypothetical protein
MTAAELCEIVLSPDFKAGLEELSSYLSSIMQEGPIVHLFAKYLWKQKRQYSLERNRRHDLTIFSSDAASKKTPTTIEFKFNYDTCADKLIKERKKLPKELDVNSLSKMRVNTWGVIPRIWKDVITKKPDLFVWIVCSRDLSKLSDDNLERIVNWKPLINFRDRHAYKIGREFLVPIDGFLEDLQKVRPFAVSTAEIETVGSFPSIYHFRICDFTNR